MTTSSSSPVPAFLVEDRNVIRESLTAVLAELANVEVVAYSEGQRAAVAWFRAHPLDWRLAIVDLFLLDGNGLGVLAALRRRESTQKVVVLTNYATDQMRFQCSVAGADAVFDKSTELEEFLKFCTYGLGNLVELAGASGHGPASYQ